MPQNPLASSYVPDFSEADPPKPWGMESPGNNLALAVLQKGLDQRASATRVLQKGGASATDYAQTAGFVGKELIDNAIESIKSGVTLPHDVMAGDVDPLSPEGIGRALDMAGLMAGGGLTEKAGPGKLGSSPMRPAPKAEIMAKPAEPFYSAIDRAIEAARTNSASPQQWAATIKNAPGVKQEEVDWLGLNDMLAKHEGPITKQQLQDYIDQHKVQLGETWKKGRSVGSESWEEATDELTDRMAEEYRRTHPDATDDEVDRYLMDRSEDIAGLDGPDTPKYTDYATPGAENYRELLLRVPGKGDGNAYKSSHWDESNVLAHLRMSDRKLPDGGKSLFLEELQSDWHQAGRKKGYGTPQYRVYDKNDRPIAGPFSSASEAERVARGMGDPFVTWDRQETAGGGVPDAPFKKTWPDLLLKRAVREAVDNGYDSISWTSGATQADRYDLSKQINEITFDSHGRLRAKDHGGNTVIDKQDVKEQDLPDLVGKEVADRILSNEDYYKNGKPVRFSGLDLKVGGEGMKAFYDKELPARAKKLFKTEVTSQDLPDGETIHVMKLTPEFKQQVREKGFPLFSAGVPVAGDGDQDHNLSARGSGAILRPGAPSVRLVPVDHDPFARGDR